MIRVINEVMVMGNMVMDAEWKDATENSQCRAYFKFALSSEKPGGKPVYVDVIAWDRHAKNIAKYCGKGKELYIKGHLGFWNNSTHIVVDKVVFGSDSTKSHNSPQPQPLSSSEQPRQAAPPPTATVEPDYDDSDLYSDPDSYVEDHVEEIPAKEAVTMKDREELAESLTGLGLDTEDLKDMLMKLTMKDMEARRNKDQF